MAGDMAGWLTKKYGIQQQEADSQTRLAQAQADEAAARTATIGPTATAAIGETRARQGLYGAQTATAYDNLAPIGVLGATALHRGMQSAWGQGGVGGGPGLGSGSGPGSGQTPDGSYDYTDENGVRITGDDKYKMLSFPHPLTGSGVSKIQNINPNVTAPGVDPNDPRNYRIPSMQFFAEGTERVMTSPTGVPPLAPPVSYPVPPGTPDAGFGRRKSLAGTIAAYAQGTSQVPSPPTGPTPPSPGDTVTSGNWGTDGQNQALRRSLGYGPKAFAKGTSKVSGKPAHGRMPPSAPLMPPPGAMPPQGVPSLAQAGPVMPGPMAQPQGAPGLAAMLQAALGASRVPGHGMGDKVPAMLEPGEAVVNKGGIKHIPGGREAIAKANAKGNAERGMRKGMGKPALKGNHVNVHIKMA